MKYFIVILFFWASIVQADEFENYLNYRAGLEEYKGDIKCATKYETQLRLLLSNPSKNNINKLQLISMAEPDRTDSLSTEHFTLHWNVSGYHSVPLEDLSSNGIPDYIDTAAVVLEHVWEVEINQMNYSPPPQQNGQPVTKYHVYFTDMSYYGITTGSGIDIPSLPGTNWTSYLELENDYQESIFYSQGFDGLRVTAAHEFHHAIQFGYNVRQEDFFFYEMTSTWMEDVLYTDINDYYNYLGTLFAQVGNRSFDDFSLYAYGNCLYVHMLEKKYGPGIVQKIWNQIKSDYVIDALANVLPQSPYNSTWLKSLAEYGVWLYFTGDRSNSVQFFPEGENYPQIFRQRFDVIEFAENLDIESNVLPNSTKYIKLVNIDKNLNLNLWIYSNAVSMAGFNVLSSNKASQFYSEGEILKNFNANEDSAIIVLTNAEDIEDNFHILNLIPDDFKISQNFPNPFNNKTSILVELIDNTNFSLAIYNGIGEKIKVLQKKETKPTGFYIYNWYGDNDVGKSVASGFYFAAFESNIKRKVLKIMYIK